MSWAELSTGYTGLLFLLGEKKKKFFYSAIPLTHIISNSIVDYDCHPPSQLNDKIHNFVLYY